MKTIHILCNSPQCLAEITSGAWPALNKKDLFTCNNAFTFFRTTGVHYTFFTDTIDIMRQLIMPEQLSDHYDQHVKKIFSQWAMELKNGNLIERDITYSPINIGASSALGALAFALCCLQYDEAYLIGYTLDEGHNKIWDEILAGHIKEEIRPHVFKFTRKDACDDFAGGAVIAHVLT